MAGETRNFRLGLWGLFFVWTPGEHRSGVELSEGEIEALSSILKRTQEG